MTSARSSTRDQQSVLPSEGRRIFRPWQVALIVCVLYLGTVAVRYQNVLEFVRMGAQYAGEWGTYVRDQDGYDGQFGYYLAVDPFHAADHLDAPAYRTQRILYPLLARVIALGSVTAIPFALVIINVAALVAGTAMLEGLLAIAHVRRWYALVYGLFAGLMVAVRSSTNEPLAYALVIAAIWSAQREQIVGSTVLLALAAFAKETTLIFAAGHIVYYVARHQWRAVSIVGAGVGIPFAVWQLLLYSHYGVFGIASGGAGATPFEIVPFGGIWQIGTAGVRVFLTFGLLPLLIAFVPTFWALWQTIHDLLAGRQHLYVYLLLANAVVMPFLPFSTYREPLGLFRFLVGMVICVLLYSAWHKAYRPLRYSLLWLLCGLVVLA